jgi:hypothetical protein
MKKPKAKERRQYPRIEQRLSLNVAANGYDLSTTTQNLSCIGAYCHIDKYIPPFTRVMVKLNLPNGDGSSSVECKGVIVRAEDEPLGGFNVAIFFNGIKDTQKQKISQYVSQFLSQNFPS